MELQRRLAARVLKCGKSKVWMDPSEVTGEISLAASHKAVRKLIKNGLIVKKSVVGPSRGSWRIIEDEKLRGRHRGVGKRFGTLEARSPSKTVWIKRIRALRKLLHKFKDGKKITTGVHRQLYLQAKGGMYRSKKHMMDAIFKVQAEAVRIEALKQQQLAKQRKIQARREAKSAASVKLGYSFDA